MGWLCVGSLNTPMCPVCAITCGTEQYTYTNSPYTQKLDDNEQPNRIGVYEYCNKLMGCK